MREYFARLVKSLGRLRILVFGPRPYSQRWASADDVRLFWFIQTYRDLPRLRKTLASVRTFYPDSEVLVVSDGDPDPDIFQACMGHSVSFTQRPRLYGVEHGGELVQKILESFLATEADILVKIDPDTDIRRRFSILPSPLDAAIYGTVESAGSSSNRMTSIQGGCIIVPRQAAIRLAASGLLASERLKPPMLEWAIDDESRARAASGLTSSDRTLGWACRQLGIACKDHPEVFSRYGPSLVDSLTVGPMAVSHPRFEIGQLANSDFYFSGLRTAVRQKWLGRGTEGTARSGGRSRVSFRSFFSS
jgi:hypothetical protein